MNWIMRGAVVKRLGDPGDEGTIVIEDSLPPLEGDVAGGRVRVIVHVVSLNFADLLQVKGQYQERKEPPFIFGTEFSGVVAAVGEGSRLVVGQRVCGVTSDGAVAEKVEVPSDSLFPVPDGVSMEDAASSVVAMGTAWMALMQRARMNSTSRVLVLGAAGGVGSMAVQLCKAIGAHVTGTATNHSKADFVRRLGASSVVEISRTDKDPRNIAKLIRETSKKAQFDIVLDNVGGAPLEAALKCTRWGGQICVVGFASGSVPSLPANILLVKNLTVHGIYWGGHLAQGIPSSLRDSGSAAMSLLQAKRIQPEWRQYELSEITKACQAFQLGHAYGKILIRVRYIPNAAL
ncbi:hypothetical protein NDN08_007405 [Rhodosorus marinus]|uniref:Enoyl reductase (ER) domain-containing protein n=1 Tax=Rhodosorus marinus TaxID=101924 RepID=A0AAV8UXG4_9RHOD|nr:hypothetical protein NDN08_007405 [Rhodosorus marinus]